MKKLIPLFLFAILVFVTYQNASALTLDATPRKQEFGPNEWIRVDLQIQGYVNGDIKWVAHRPDNSIINGTVLQQVKNQKVMHQIIRDAYDNEFGPWSIDYQYGGITKTVHFNVGSLNLAIFMDKVTYYEPNIMNINITSSYYEPYAKFAKSYYLNFYDRDGNLVTGLSEIEVKADRPSSIYHFPMILLAKYNPPGLYKLKVQYFNSVIEVPFLLGDIHKLMELTTQNAATYYQGSDVSIDIIFSRVTQSTATLKITDPLGNTTSQQFQPHSVHDTLILKNFSKKIGRYSYEIRYAGTTTSGSFNVINNPHEIPNVSLTIIPDKLNYRPGEIVNVKVHTSQVITDSINYQIIDPSGKTSQNISFPIDTTETIIPHKIEENDSIGQWKIYVNYDSIERFSSFNVAGLPVRDSETFDITRYNIPTFVSRINSTFKSPTDITIDSNNNTYVMDSGNFQVKKFDNNGNLILFWGSSSSQLGQFKNPSGIFVNEKYVYVVDSGNARINMFNKTGSFVHSWGTYGDNSGMFHIPVTINSNHNGELFVADSEDNSIQIFNIIGDYKDQVDSSFSPGASFSGIRALTFDSQNNLFAISTDDKILKYSNIGNFLNFYGSNGNEEGRFNNPSAIAIDSKNNIYVADTDNHRIQKFDSSGNFILSFGKEGTGQGEFEQPVGLAIDAADNIYVVDKKNNNVQKFALYPGINKNVVPSWVRNTATWWAEGAMDKKDLSKAIRFVAIQGLIKTSSINQNDIIKIPNWLKGNVKNWSSGNIDDDTFLTTIEYLISIGAMKI